MYSGCFVAKLAQVQPRNDVALYSGTTPLESRPGHRLSWDWSLFFFRPSRTVL